MPNMPNNPFRDPRLLAIVLASLAARAQSGEREGGVRTFEQLLEGGCPHQQQVAQLQAELKNADAQLERNGQALEQLRALVRDRTEQYRREPKLADYVQGHHDFLAQLRAFLLVDDAPRNGAEAEGLNGRAATVGGEAIAQVHAEAAAQERDAMASAGIASDRASLRAGAGIQGRNPEEVTASEYAALYQAADEIGSHAAAMLDRLNDRLPRGFFAHITIAKKD